MKKIISILAVALLAASVFAVSYKNNTFQKLADEYTKKAEIALDAGQYDDAVEYSKKAEENAALSEAYIKMMMARGEAETVLSLQKIRLLMQKKLMHQIHSQWLILLQKIILKKQKLLLTVKIMSRQMLMQKLLLLLLMV